MRLLLDTHVALWALASPDVISDAGQALILDPGNDVYVSTICIWEIAIKRALGRPGAPTIPAEAARDKFVNAGFAILDVSAAHAIATESLPPIHTDPFDRMLVAQALTEPMRLLTRDRLLSRYGPTVIQV